MTDQRTPSKPELLAALRENGRQVVDTLRGLPAERFELRREEGSWSGRQLLAHIAAIEWTMPRLLDLARQPTAGQGAESVPSATLQGGQDSYNERQVARRAHLSVAELIEEFERNRAATIAAVEAADDALLATRIRSGGGVVGPAATVLRHVAIDHTAEHTREIADAH